MLHAAFSRRGRLGISHSCVHGSGSPANPGELGEPGEPG